MYDLSSKLDIEELVKSQFLLELNRVEWRGAGDEALKEYLHTCNCFLLEQLNEDIQAEFDPEIVKIDYKALSEDI